MPGETLVNHWCGFAKPFFWDIFLFFFFFFLFFFFYFFLFFFGHTFELSSFSSFFPPLFSFFVFSPMNPKEDYLIFSMLLTFSYWNSEEQDHAVNDASSRVLIRQMPSWTKWHDFISWIKQKTVFTFKTNKMKLFFLLKQIMTQRTKSKLHGPSKPTCLWCLSMFDIYTFTLILAYYINSQ